MYAVSRFPKKKAREKSYNRDTPLEREAAVGLASVTEGVTRRIEKKYPLNLVTSN